ncbi:MAG TPA: hypothetical protein VND93_32655 [Myxococcales bacterium]|nr:hypothetical protein [Myxococcales bacterium]
MTRTKLNAEWHKPALLTFAAIVLAHWAEHLAQAFQIYALHMPVPDSRGVLGQFFPWLVKSEAMHYGYALVMLVGLWLYRGGFKGRARTWWNVSLAIQFWHHIEHALLQAQAIAGHNLFNRPVPTSILQLWFPRVELHLFYNAVVFIPMAVGMYYHLFPSAEEEAQHACSCAVHARPKMAAQTQTHAA